MDPGVSERFLNPPYPPLPGGRFWYCMQIVPTRLRTGGFHNPHPGSKPGINVMEGGFAGHDLIQIFGTQP